MADPHYDIDAFIVLEDYDHLIGFDAELVRWAGDNIMARGFNTETGDPEERSYEVDDTPSFRDHWNPWTEQHYTTDVPNRDVTLIARTPLL
ncbi:MAG: hypothetical protein GY903_01040 [Fuerstiella sp.]|nr:hypothetical protein [Fuerstiella sp.]MCP4853063.1 hypothetical protein [Fuerstiella sp.]